MGKCLDRRKITSTIIGPPQLPGSDLENLLHALSRVLGTLGTGSPTMEPVLPACPSRGITLQAPQALLPAWKHRTPAPTMRVQSRVGRGHV